MNWTTKTLNKCEVLVSGDFPCKNGRQQLRESGKMRGTFTDADAAKAHAAFIMDQRKPSPRTQASLPAPKRERKGGGSAVHPKIFGFSACAVLKALGRVGIKYPEADAILKRHGIEMPKAFVSVQLGFGRNEHTWQRHGQPAPLTPEQLNELGVAHD
ncbi:hypothetical protein H5P28_06215 [Ruficoccus amylovorans]|uniref:Uncharacterized protein n=1 Tax=Ruficoccus amylovorans TaxID=1804625 RepID=A0A842HEW2_9BACT|nr:hypothetical protein [Ruficoccus amylovorans]MBC2593851.1 hypothetical protein [Ruficoccus amylovorans]